MSGTLVPHIANPVIRRFSIFANRAAWSELQTPIGTGTFSSFIQSMKAKSLLTKGIIGMTSYNTLIQLKDNKDDFEAKKITAPQAILGGAAALCGAISSTCGTAAVAFCWARATNVLTAVKYTIGGAEAFEDPNNRIDLVNASFAQFGTYPGKVGAGISVLSGGITAYQSATHGQVKAKVIEVAKTSVDHIVVWTTIANVVDKLNGTPLAACDAWASVGPP